MEAMAFPDAMAFVRKQYLPGNITGKKVTNNL